MSQQPPPPLHPGDEVLLEVSGELTPADRASLRSLRFTLPRGAAALALQVDYAPRWDRDEARNRSLVEDAVDEQLRAAAAEGVAIAEGTRESILAQPSLRAMYKGLRNLLNAELIDPSGLQRGRWDRNLEGESAEGIIAANWAEPGFVPGPLLAGEWLITLEIHEVISEVVRFQLRVTALARDPASPTQPRRSGGRSGAAPRREFDAPLPAGWIRGELHSHSTASDGIYAPEELVDRAKAMGLDFIAITDHNSLAGAVELRAARSLRGSRDDVAVIPGCEITTFCGHFLCLGLHRTPAWHAGERQRSAAELAADVRGQGGLFGLAHPFVLGAPVCVGCRLATSVPFEEVELLEVWSRGEDDPIANRCALALFDRLRREGRRVAAVAGRDWHGPAQERAAAGMRFPANVVRAAAEPRAVLEALARGACYLSVGPLLDFELVCDGRTAPLGADLHSGGGPVGARLAVEALEERALVRLVVGGRLVREEELAGPGVIEQERLPAEPGGARVELRSAASGMLLALTNPIEFL